MRCRLIPTSEAESVKQGARKLDVGCHDVQAEEETGEEETGEEDEGKGKREMAGRDVHLWARSPVPGRGHTGPDSWTRLLFLFLRVVCPEA